MQKKTIVVIILILLIIAVGALLIIENNKTVIVSYKNIEKTSIGTVEKIVYGNESADNTIALITGIHPREKLSIDPEIKAAKEFVRGRDDVKIIHYQVNVTEDPEDYDKGRANGESLVHDFVNPDVTKSDADCVIISHSHIDSYGEGFYLATPEMDDASVSIAEKIQETSDFGYYPKTGKETYRSTSAVLVSCPIAQAGYPTFVYEIPEDITEQDSTDWTKNLFDLMVEYAC